MCVNGFVCVKTGSPTSVALNSDLNIGDDWIVNLDKTVDFSVGKINQRIRTLNLFLNY